MSSSNFPKEKCRQFSLDVIRKATNDFAESKVLGKGGEGKVYLADVYLHKTPVAVKLLLPNSVGFEDEIRIVSEIQHPNLVSLIGYCQESEHRILVYEYMANGRLSDYVAKKCNIYLSWLQRLKICLGAARGLQHLHTKTAHHPKGIVHRDIKPDNILIDENWVGKISDFGMFKLSQADQATSTMVTMLKGTAGFYAPEYLRYGKVTRKIDVYAFGVVLFLLLCRKMPWDRDDETYIAREDEDLGHWADQNIDNKIKEDISKDCLKVFTDIIRRSLRENPNERPTMDDVVLNLEDALKFQQPREEEDERLQEGFQQPREEEDKGLQEVFRPLDPRSYFTKASDGDSYYHVFLNYDLESLEKFAIFLFQALEHAGFRTFIEKWSPNKSSEYEAIRNSTCAVLLFCEASFDSAFIEQLRKIMRPSSKRSFNFSLLPIYYGESDKLGDRISSAVRELSEYQPIIFASRDPGDRKMFLDEIVEMIRRKFKGFRINATRFEEKFSNIESENQVLRRQALTMSPTGKFLSARPKTMIIQTTPENGNSHNGEARLAPEMALALSNPREPESEEKPQKSLNEKQVENQDLLIKCISQDLGFSGGKPIAACVIYKCLLHWRSFEVERTTVFDRIIQTIASAIEVQDNNDVLAYWLCNTSTLLMLLQHTLKASGAASMTPQRRRSSSASLFGRMSQGLRGSPQSAGLSFLNGRVLGRLDDLRQVEAKYPALLFKQQLTAFLEKIYGMMRDNLKKEISPLLGLCIQAPRTSSLVKGRAQDKAVAQQALFAHWLGIVKSLNSYLNTMKANYVPPFLVRKVFTQIFSFINVQLFNSLLLRRECCSFSNGEYVKSGLAELEQWCCFATEEYAGSAWDELKHIRQAVGFLVIIQKPKKSLNEITNELCPVLSIHQLYRISMMYWDDKYGTHSVSSEVISSMRVLMTEDSNNAVSSSFLLDDDDSIPFSVDDISKSMPLVDIANVELPPLLRENSGFRFLHQRAD